MPSPRKPARVKVEENVETILTTWLRANMQYHPETQKPLPVATAVACADHFHPNDEAAQTRLLRKLERLVYQVVAELHPDEQFNIPK